MRYQRAIRMVFIIFLCLLLPFNILAYAYDDLQTTDVGTPTVTDWAYVNQTATNLSISTSGEATATGQLIGYSGVTTEVWIFLYLERYSSGSWATVNSWYQSFDSYRGTLQSSTYVSSGYWYRVRASYYAYSGDDSEHIVQYSGSVYH